MNNKFEERLKNFPEIIISPVEMNEPNQPITIFEGDFKLKYDDKEILINGQIQFEWFPNTGARFSGNTSSDLTDINNKPEILNQIELILDGLKFGDCFITNIKFNNHDNPLKGILKKDAVKGDKSIPVNKINLAIPNLREFYGTRVKNKNGDESYPNRIILENNEYQIIIDKCPDYRDLEKSLKSKGGYIVLYSGELTKKKGNIKFDQTEEIFDCLSTFLDFLNGRRCSALFRQGIFENEIKWCDFSHYLVDPYKSVITWPQRYNITGLNELWQNFSNFWKDENEKDFLISAIHWYLESNSNSNSGFLQSPIITTQIALELIYNWFIIEKKKMLIKDDSKNILASNKIRLLLSQLNVDNEIPQSFTNLQSFIDENKDIIDGPEALVQVRNSIVHSQEEKRKKLAKIPSEVMEEILQLGIWYIELSLLNILEFEGEYYNRCSKKEEFVPWSEKKR
jgi:hypothetical protein